MRVLKKCSAVLALVLIVLFAMPVFAYEPSGELDLVTDAAKLLTDAELKNLNTVANTLSGKYECDVMVITVKNTEGHSPRKYSELVFDQFDLGYDSERSVIMLLVSMEKRDYVLTAYGFGNTAFTDYGKDRLTEKFLPLLSKGNYAKSFTAYLEGCGKFLQLARAGKPVDSNRDPEKQGKTAGLILLLGPLGAALATIFVLRQQMKSAGVQTAARNYIPKDGFVLHRKEDQYLHTTTTRTKREKASTGTSIDIKGFSQKSGKF